MKTTFSGWHYLWKSEDIRRKLLITFGLLVLYRFAANVPAPGVDHDILTAFRNTSSGSGGFLGFLDLLSGGTVSNFSLLSMGVYPYITAQIIIQLLIPIIPALQQRIQDDPREGRRWQEKWTYYLSVPMAALSAIGQINIFNSLSIQAVGQPILPFGLFDPATSLASWSVLVAMTAGTMFAIWLGELISDIGERVYLRSEAEARQRHDISVISAPVYDHHRRQIMVVSLQIGRAMTDSEIARHAKGLTATADALTAGLGGSKPQW